MEVRHKEEFGEDAFKGLYSKLQIDRAKVQAPDYDKETLDLQDTEIGYTREILNNKELES